LGGASDSVEAKRKQTDGTAGASSPDRRFRRNGNETDQMLRLVVSQ
jgi:hypothetical protein